MSRWNSSGSRGHWVRKTGAHYTIGWVLDRYYKGSRLRHPTTYGRVTDEAGARRFCKKWDIPLPDGLR